MTESLPNLERIAPLPLGNDIYRPEMGPVVS